MSAGIYFVYNEANTAMMDPLLQIQTNPDIPDTNRIRQVFQGGGGELVILTVGIVQQITLLCLLKIPDRE